MLLAFLGYKDGKIEPLGTGDTDFSGFFFSTEFGNLLYKKIKVDKFRAERIYNKLGCYTKHIGYNKILYVLNTEHDINPKHFSEENFNNIKQAMRSYKIQSIIE